MSIFPWDRLARAAFIIGCFRVPGALDAKTLKLAIAEARVEAKRKDSLVSRLKQFTLGATLVLCFSMSHHNGVGGRRGRLQRLDCVQSLPLKQFLVDFCSDFSTLLGADRPIAVEGIELLLPRATAIPLSLIANELITNAVKYGSSGIKVLLERNPKKGYALSVSNDGVPLPDGFALPVGNGQGCG